MQLLKDLQRFTTYQNYENIALLPDQKQIPHRQLTRQMHSLSLYSSSHMFLLIMYTIIHMTFYRLYKNQLLHDRFRIRDRKSTRLNSSHVSISYAVFCLKKKSI